MALLHLGNKGFEPWIDGTESNLAPQVAEEGREMLLKIRDEFSGDTDGHELWEYLREWACELSSAVVKLLHMDI